MGGLCGCCADEPPENGTMMDHKNGMELIALTEEEEIESVEEVRQTFMTEEGVAEFDYTSTGEMVLPTYPLRDAFAQELKRQIKDGRFSVKRKPKATENLRNLLSDSLRKQCGMAAAGRKTFPQIESAKEIEESSQEDEPEETAAAIKEAESEEEEEDEEEDEDQDEDEDEDGNGSDDGAAGVTADDLPLIVPIIVPKELMRPQVWGIFGDWKDLMDPAGLLMLAGYERECWEYCMDVDKEERWLRAKEMRENGVSEEQILGLGLLSDENEDELKRGYGTVTAGKECYEFALTMPGNEDGCKMRPSYIGGEYGDSSSWLGVYRYVPFREVTSFEFWRGNYATGVRGIIDPFDPDNPYGPKSSADWGNSSPAGKKSSVDMKKVSFISMNQTAATLNDNDLSKISNVSQIDMTIAEHDLEDVESNHGCLYQKAAAGPMGSILLSKSVNENHLEIPTCPNGKLFDDAVACLKEFTKGADLGKISSLKCHVNTWGLSSNNWFADEMVTNMTCLTKFDLSDTVNYRHRSDLCMGIKSILMAAVTKDIQYIDLSDNFLDMDGGRAFASFLGENKSLEVLKVNRCSLGLKATEQIIDALTKNHNLNLTEFQAAGNDFCVDSMKQLVEVFEEMETLEIVNMSNCINPYKPHSGLKYLIQALVTNRRTLQYVDVSGNTWNNDMEVVQQIQEMLQKCLVMKSLNISCLGVDKKGCQVIIKTFLDCANDVWGLDCNLKRLIWNKDLRCSPQTALQFAEKDLPNIYNLKLKHIQLQGVLRKLENRDKIKHALKNIDITCVLDGSWSQEETEEVSNVEYPETKV